MSFNFQRTFFHTRGKSEEEKGLKIKAISFSLEPIHKLNRFASDGGKRHVKNNLLLLEPFLPFSHFSLPAVHGEAKNSLASCTVVFATSSSYYLFVATAQTGTITAGEKGGEEDAEIITNGRSDPGFFFYFYRFCFYNYLYFRI